MEVFVKTTVVFHNVNVLTRLLDQHVTVCFFELLTLDKKYLLDITFTFSEFVQRLPPEVFCKKSVLINFTEYIRKHLCQSFFFNKVAGQRPVTLLEKSFPQVSSSEFCEIFKNTFFIEHLRMSAFIFSL